MSTHTPPVVGGLDLIPAPSRRPAVVFATLGACAIALGGVLFAIGMGIAASPDSESWDGVGQMILGVLSAAAGLVTATTAALCSILGARRRGTAAPIWAKSVAALGCTSILALMVSWDLSGLAAHPLVPIAIVAAMAWVASRWSRPEQGE